MSASTGGEPELDIEHQDRYTAATFRGAFSVQGFQRRAEAASRACRERGTGRLLVDTTCFDVAPTTTERYELATHAVRISAGLKVALVVTAKFIDPNRFGIVVAQNRGLAVEAFTDRQKAVDWLLAPTSEKAGPPATS